jgi:excisionase family DNA binding protein
MTTPAPFATVLHLPGPAAADALGVSLRTLQRWAERGDIQRHQLGGRTLYRVEPVATPATPAPATVAPLDDAGGALVTALVAAVERATRAEIERDQLRAQLDDTRAQLDRAGRLLLQTFDR